MTKSKREVRLQDRLGKQNFQENVNKSYEPLTDTIEDTSRDITKTKTEVLSKNNKAISDLNEKV